MTDDAIKEYAATAIRAVEDTARKAGLSRAETAAVYGVALVEGLGRRIGPIATIERLRTIADLLEEQYL